MAEPNVVQASELKEEDDEETAEDSPDQHRDADQADLSQFERVGTDSGVSEKADDQEVGEHA